jgi:hypothetical protein
MTTGHEAEASSDTDRQKIRHAGKSLSIYAAAAPHLNQPAQIEISWPGGVGMPIAVRRDPVPAARC